MMLVTPDVRALVERIALSHGVTFGDVMGRCRERRPSRARREAWTTLRHTLELSYPHLGRMFGRDHTTVLVGVRQREAELQAMYAEAAE